MVLRPTLSSMCPGSGASGGANLWLCGAASPHQPRWRDRQTRCSCAAVSEGPAQTYTGYDVQVNDTEPRVKYLQREQSKVTFEFNCLLTCVYQVQSGWVLPSGAGGFRPEQSTGCTGEPVWATGSAQRLREQQHRESGLPASGLLTNTLFMSDAVTSKIHQM